MQNSKTLVHYEKGRYKKFLSAILPIALPIVIQNGITSALGMLDVVMLGHLGNREISTISIAAANQANRSFFVIQLFFFGVAAGASIFFSQFYGKKDYKGIQRILGLVLTIGLLLSLVPFLGSIFFPREIMGLFISKNDIDVLNLGSKYISIVGLAYPILIVSTIYAFALRSIGNAMVPMIASISALLVNAFINYFLIYGHAGFPALGVEGSAIGTVIARVIELAIILFYIYFHKDNPLRASIRRIFSFTFKDVKEYFKISFFVIMEEGLWGTAMTVQFAFFGYMGRATAAASAIMGPFIDLSLVTFFALGQGASVVVGNMIGEGKSHKEVKWVSWRCIELSIISSIFIMLIFGILPQFLIPLFYHVEQTTIDLAKYSLIVFEGFIIVRGSAMLGVIGPLRGAGDTLFCMLVDVCGAWFIMVPVVYITGFVFHLSLPFVLLSSYLFDCVALILVVIRLRGESFINDVSYEVTKA